MKKLSIILIVINLIALLGYFNYSIQRKEKILNNGTLVLLKLAPVDPRSLMQGDYMRLSYDISQNVFLDSIPRRGYVVLNIDSNQIAHKIRYQQYREPLNPNEYLIEYSSPDNWALNIGAESYFFEEGTGERYKTAQYGGLKIDKNGNSLLVGLYDKDFNKIE